MQKKRQKLTNAIAASTLLATAGQVLAQASLEEIIVTAQKREQSIQDIPFSVTALSGESLRNSGVFDIIDLQSTTPSLFTPSTGSPGQGASFRLRGFGSPPFQLGIEPAVATFMDGVYRSRSGVAVNDLVDINRVEILKGPQGTLFGKNTTAGVVHIVSNKPNTEEFEGFVEASYEKYDRTRIKGMVNIPLARDTAALRVTGMWGDGDGWLENVGPIQDQHNLDRSHFRAQFLFTPSDRFDLRLTAEYGQIDEACCTSMRLADGPFTGPLQFFASFENATVISPPDLDGLRTSINEDMNSDAEDSLFAAEFNWQISDNITLTSITSYQNFELSTLVDGDFTGADMLVIDSDVEIEAITQELRLSGTSDALEWTLGAYYSDEDIDRVRRFIWQSQVGLFFPPPFNPMPGLGVVDTLAQQGTSYSLFAHAIFNVSERFSLTAGVRLNEEEKDGQGIFDQPNPIVLAPVNPTFDVSIDEDEPTYTLSFQYDVSDETTGYLTYSRGYKAGGINLAREASGLPGSPPDALFDAEIVDSFELGLKVVSMNDRLRMNVAAFINQYDDVQNQIFLPPLFVVRNGEGADVRGIEFEGDLAVSDHLSLSLAATMLETEFDDGTDLGNGDIGGRDLPWAPSTAVSLGWNYDRPITGGLAFFWSGSALSKSSYFANSGSLDNTRQGSHEILNTRLGIRAADNKWNVALWCRNCTDERVSEVIFTSPVDFFPGMGAAVETYVNRPIEVGITGRFNF